MKKLKKYRGRYNKVIGGAFVLLFAAIATKLIFFSHAATFTPPTVPGQSYQICSANGSQYLTSPWTYNALSSGSQSYTVSQYEALPGYGTTLPPLPSYISSEPSTTTAAFIYAPGASAGGPAYDYPLSPVLQFFEGGAYPGGISFQTAPGDEFIGGSTTGNPDPQFTGGSILTQNDSYDFNGGGSTLAVSASAGSTTVTTNSAIGGYIGQVTFGDGTSYGLSGHSGTTLTLSSPLTASEAAGTSVWAGRSGPITALASAAAQGAKTIILKNSSVPLVPWENLNVGAGNGLFDSVQVASVSGSQSGYTLTLTQPLSQAAVSSAPVYYGGSAGDVTVEYLNIGSGGGNNTLWPGSGWTIEHNNIHDNYAGGSNYLNTSASGQAIINPDNAVIEYNCFQREGEYALNGGGSNTKFDYNQVDDTPYQPDLSGNGQSGCGKWWGSTNNDILDNSFTDEHYSGCIWFDNGNTGMQVSGNYFYNIDNRTIQNETGWNASITNNLFEDVNGGVYMNDSGGWNIPGSRYNNEVIISGNTFDNVLNAVNIWGASGRSCLNSGEAVGLESAFYCSGGFPQMPPGQQDFSHYADSAVGGGPSVLQNTSCSAASPCSTITLTSAVSPEDWIGFNGQAPNTCSSSTPCGSITSDPVQTTTSSTASVTSFTSSSPGNITVSSTTGFPSSGQLEVPTSTGSPYLAVGAIVSYTGITATSFTGVVLVSGSGTLSNGGLVIAVQPYHVTAVNCPGGNCTNNTVVTVSPAITTNVSAGTTVYATGTCNYYATTTATGSSPVAPDGIPYIDGCMWEDRNISVQSNTFYVDPTSFDSTPLPTGESGNWSCTTGSGGNCAQNAMGYQYPGADAQPFNNVSFSNAMMSDSNLPAPLNNLNANGSPLATGSGGDVGANSETPYNDLWTGNTYNGTWTFQAYTQAAGCPVNWSGSALVWAGGSGNACAGLTLAQWQTYWGQDTLSSVSGGSVTVSFGSPSANQEIYGPNGTIAVTASASGSNTVSGCSLSINGTSIGTQNASPYNFTLNTLNYSDGTYTLAASCTDNQSNNGTGSESVYISNGDLNGDGSVGLSDLAIMTKHWLQTDSNYADGNITGQSTINVSDLSVLAKNWNWKN